MSASYAEKMAYKVHPGSAKVMFADESVGETKGIIKVRMSVIRGSLSRTSSVVPWTKGQVVRFCVLDDLSFDIILGEKTLDKFKVFALSEACLITVETPNEDLALSTIRLLSPFEKMGTHLKNRLANLAKRRPDQLRVSEESENTSKHFCHQLHFS
jgi:hypothetical protein